MFVFNIMFERLAGSLFQADQGHCMLPSAKCLANCLISAGFCLQAGDMDAAMSLDPPVSARKRKKKDKKVTALEHPVLSGTLFRGSHVVPDCVKLREALLFE